jgi:hypothetical protein
VSTPASEDQSVPPVEPVEKPRVDPAGRPTENRGTQAIIAIGIILAWIVIVSLIFRAARLGGNDDLATFSMMGIAVACWLIIEAIGGKRGPIWPASALAIVGSISLGFTTSMSLPEVRMEAKYFGIALISGMSALSMAAFLFRFRLPGLVSPVITFAIIALFLFMYGADPQSMAKIEGISARGILAVLLESSFAIVTFAVLAAFAMILARHLDLSGDDFGVAAARPLHVIGGGVAALIIGRALALLPLPFDLIALGLYWVGAWVWALRLNRIAVLGAMHLAIARPVVLGIATPLGIEIDITGWIIITAVIILIDIAMWPWLHHLSLRRGWILGPGGRVPKERKGWVWRYWPYA